MNQFFDAPGESIGLTGSKVKMKTLLKEMARGRPGRIQLILGLDQGCLFFSLLGMQEVVEEPACGFQFRFSSSFSQGIAADRS